MPKARTVPLAGNSIGTDRRFLAAQLPAIEEFLHYRSVDVSTVKELARRWFPEVMAELPPRPGATGPWTTSGERGRAGLLPIPDLPPSGARVVPPASPAVAGPLTPTRPPPTAPTRPATPERSTDGPTVRAAP